jgi:excisionase family DNA binding protein
MAGSRPEGRRLLTLLEAADYLAMTEKFMRTNVLRRTIPFYKIGKFIRFDQAELDAWIDERRRPPEE